MLRRVNIGNKLALTMLGLSLLVTALLASLFYLQFDSALKERVMLQLSSVKQLKTVRIKTELEDRMNAFNQMVLDLEGNKLPDQQVFFHIKQYQEIPSTLPLTDLTLTEELFSKAPRMIDLSANDRSGVMIGIFQKRDNHYVTALAKVPEIQDILLERTGLGQTGESYLVGQDYFLKTTSRFYKDHTEPIVVDTEGVRKALSKKSGEAVILDYRKQKVFSSFEKIQFSDITWVILSEINYEEALFPLEKLRENLIFTLTLIVLFIAGISYLLSRILIRPVLSMEKHLMGMAAGKLQEVNHSNNRRDEIGRMFHALEKLVSALKRTVIFANEIGSGNFHAEYQPLSDEDKLGAALIQMKEKLKAFKKNEQMLLQENQRSILRGEEKERSRLSKEMHDGIGPLLTTLRMNIQAADLQETTKTQLLRRMDETISEIRRMSNNLMPSVLVDFGAGEAIGNLLLQIEKDFSIQIFYRNDMSAESDIPDDIHTTLYRIVQESVNNVIKHANATEIRISISQFPDHIGLFISDNGEGFQMDGPTDGNGIQNMKERAKLANGTFDIRTGNRGTTIEVEIPTL